MQRKLNPTRIQWHYRNTNAFFSFKETIKRKEWLLL